MLGFVKRNINKLFFCAFLAAGLLFIGADVSAASLYLSPAAGSFRVGESFQVGVFVSSADQAMNTAQALISFPPDKLEVISVSTKNSIFSLLVENPTFTNNSGNVNFSGIVLNPGYTGSSGRLVTINFRAKIVGQAKVSIVGGQVLANDGEGTSILASRGSASFTLIEKKIIEQPVEKQKPTVKPATTTTTVSSTPVVATTTPAVTVVTTTVNIVTSTACSLDQLPSVFLKVNSVIFDRSALSLLLLLLLIAISAAISFWGFVESFIHENKHHFKGKTFTFLKKKKLK